MYKRNSQRGQSVLEYIIVLTAIVAIILVAAKTYIKLAVETTMEKSGDAIAGAAGKISGI